MYKDQQPSMLRDIKEQIEQLGDLKSQVSDGYHTFHELYEFRKLYNAALFNEWYQQGKYEIHKSERHYDGELCFGGGWFIVVATLPTGQISNHYKLEDWDLFKCKQVARAMYPFDGHTDKDVLERLAVLEPSTSWISVIEKDKLPKKGQRCLVIQNPLTTATREPLFAVFDGKHFRPPTPTMFADYTWGATKWVDITHWQPLPPVHLIGSSSTTT